MKIYRLPQLAELNETNEYLLGPAEIPESPVYFLYGRLRPGESGRKVPGAGRHEGIVCVVKGNIQIRHGKTSFSVGAGEAFSSKEGFLLDNPGDEEAVFVAAGLSHAIVETKDDEKERAPIEAAVKEKEGIDHGKGGLKAEEEPEFKITLDDSEEADEEEAGKA